MNDSDLLNADGARIDDRETGKVSEFVPKAKIIHIDIDPAEIGKVMVPDVPIVGDVKQILQELIKAVAPKKHDEWLAHINKLKQDYPLHYPMDGVLHGQQVIEEIGNICGHDGIVVTDVGQHQMWAAQFYKCIRPRQFVTSGGLGTMGFGLPAAIGAQFGVPDKPVFCVSGDGSIQMCIQELIVATIYKLPIKICILNNMYLGMVRQWQEMFHENRYSSVDLEASPDFIKLAEAYGAHAIRCSDPSGVRAALEEAMAVTDRPTVLDFRIAKEENVFPMIPSGGTISQMVVQRPPDLTPLDSYMASETYMADAAAEKEAVPVPRQ